jgi:chemotaxis protein histidine kinase CheA
MSHLPAHILTDFADQARGLLARVESDLAEMSRAPGAAPAIEAAGRATGALRSIRTGATFLELGELATAAGEVEQRLARLQSSEEAVDLSVMDMLRAAIDTIGQSQTAAPVETVDASNAAAAAVISVQTEATDSHEPTTNFDVERVEAESEPLYLAERKAPMLGDLLSDLAASHSRLEGLALGSVAGAVDEARSETVEVEGRDLRRLGRFFGVEALEAIGAAVECAAPALRRSDDAARRALPRLRAVLNALVEFTHSLGSSRVVRRDLTATCAALKRIASGDEGSVAVLGEEATWTEILEADSKSVQDCDQSKISQSVQVQNVEEDHRPQERWREVPEIDAVAAVDAGRVEMRVLPEAERRAMAAAPEEFMHPLANVMTESARVFATAKSIPTETADPIDTVRAVNRVADDLGRAALAMKETVIFSRLRSLHPLLSDCATLVSNVSGQMGRDIRADVHGGRLDLDDAVLSRLRDPLLAIVHRVATEAARRPVDRNGHAEPVLLGLSADGEGSQVCIRVVSPSVPAWYSGDNLDVARDAIEAMAGSMELTADPSEGAAILVRVPMNLAFLDAMVVRIGETQCALPTAQIEEVIMPGAGQIVTFGLHRAVQLRRATVPMVDGRVIMSLAPSSEGSRHAVVVRAGGRRVALSVDRAMGRQEIVVRPMDRTLASAGPIRSAASIADGSAALVLDVPALVRSAATAFSTNAAA